MATCILRHSAIETVDRLFIQCLVTTDIWNNFTRVIGTSRIPLSVVDLGNGWLKGLGHANKLSWSMLAKAIIW